MANIAITSQCNLNCSYCFAQEAYQADANSVGHMPLTIYEEALDFIMRSDIEQIRILGGEPTLHPDFISYLELALKTGRPLRLFSNGFMPEKVLEFISTIPDEKIIIVLNVTHLAEDSIEMQFNLERTLMRLSEKIMPGLNIFEKGLQVEFLLDLIRNYGLIKIVRLGLAHPCIGYKNQYLLPKNYFLIGQKIADFAREAQKQSVKINLDCGFVPCMFNGEDLHELGLDTSLGNHCEPIPDILPEGSIIPCYSLSGIDRKKMDSALSADAVRKQFKEKIPEYCGTGIFKICSLCEYKSRGLCSGGCTAQKILRFHKMTKFAVKIE
jgi:radical SAM protein with 4Fe4S-binding SPASM domain